MSMILNLIRNCVHYFCLRTGLGGRGLAIPESASSKVVGKLVTALPFPRSPGSLPQSPRNQRIPAKGEPWVLMPGAGWARFLCQHTQGRTSRPGQGLAGAGSGPGGGGEVAARDRRNDGEAGIRRLPLPGLWRDHGADQRADPGPARASWRTRCLTSLKRIHRSKRLDPGPASRWPRSWRLPRNDEGDMPSRSGPPVRGQAAGPVRCQGLNSGLDFSIGVIWHSPHRR